MKNIAAGLLILALLVVGTGLSMLTFVYLPSMTSPIFLDWIHNSLYALAGVLVAGMVFTAVTVVLLLTAFMRDGYQPWFVVFATLGAVIAYLAQTAMGGMPLVVDVLAPQVKVILQVCGLVVPCAVAISCLLAYPFLVFGARLIEWARESQAAQPG